MMPRCAFGGPVTIDGPAGSGKSTVARAVAQRLGYAYLDTGALYRALAWHARARGVEPADAETLAAALRAGAVDVRREGGSVRVTVGGRVLDAELRGEAVGALASQVSAHPAVRAEMLKLQRKAAGNGRIVAEGRDMGTVVFPDAPWKFYLDADPAARAARRWRDETAAGKQVTAEAVAADMEARDRNDRERAAAPLRAAADARRIDSTRMTAEEVIETILGCVAENAGSRDDET
jgi:cytidylate kinase